MLAAAGEAAAQSGGWILIREAINRGIVQRNAGFLTVIMLIYLAVNAAGWALMAFLIRGLAGVGQRIVLGLRRDLFDHLTSLVTRPAERPSTTTWPPFRRHRTVLHHKADEALARPLRGDALERPAADEVVLIELDDPRHPGGDRVRLRVGVLPDEDVLLLQAQDPLRLEPERPAAEVGARLEERVPEVLTIGARAVQLVAKLADEADTQEQAWDAGDAGALRVEVPERVVGEVEVGEASEQVAHARVWVPETRAGLCGPAGLME
jgi:hypothetical protein